VGPKMPWRPFMFSCLQWTALHCFWSVSIVVRDRLSLGCNQYMLMGRCLFIACFFRAFPSRKFFPSTTPPTGFPCRMARLRCCPLGFIRAGSSRFVPLSERMRLLCAFRSVAPNMIPTPVVLFSFELLLCGLSKRGGHPSPSLSEFIPTGML